MQRSRILYEYCRGNSTRRGLRFNSIVCAFVLLIGHIGNILKRGTYRTTRPVRDLLLFTRSLFVAIGATFSPQELENEFRTLSFRITRNRRNEYELSDCVMFSLQYICIV